MADANNKLRQVRTPVDGFEVTESYLLDLIKRLRDVYKQASDELKNKLLQFITSNFTVDGKDVDFDVIDLCKCFIKINKEPQIVAQNDTWCGRPESNR